MSRDIVVDPVRSQLYVSQYEDGSVLRFDITTAGLVDVIPTGRGASALALAADGRVLACVNRLDASVSLIALDTGVVIATASVGKMPADIAALPGGGFAVANAFADSITIIDDETGAVATELDAPPVPAAVAATRDHLAIASRALSAIVLRSPSMHDEDRVIPFDTPPVAIEPLPDERFVVATGDSLVIVDGESGRIEHRNAFPADYLAVSDSTIYAVGGDSVTSYTFSLQELSRIPANDISALGAAEGAAFAAAPGVLLGIGPLRTDATSAEPPAVEEDGLSSETIAAAHVPEPEPEVPVEVELPEAPVEQQALPTPDLPDQPDPETLAETEQQLEEVGQVAVRPAAPRYHALRLGYISQRPHAPYLGLGAAEEFQEELHRALQFEGKYAGLLGLNWQRNPEPERFDSWIRQGATDTFEGDVEFHVDDAVVQTESMVRNDDTEDITMTGGVTVTRDDNFFGAERLQVRAPEDLTERERLAGIPIVPHGYKPPRRYAYAGFIEAEDIEWHEPYRDLVARTLQTTLDTQDIEADSVYGRAGGLFFHADRLSIAGPDSVLAEQAWVTTCDHDPPHYTLNFSDATVTDGVIRARNARLQFFGVPTPLMLPRLKFDPTRETRVYRPDIELGSSSDIGQFVNLAQWFAVSPYLELGVRTMPTTRDGFGYGLDAEYDFRGDPRTPLFRSEGSLKSLYTTNDRGYVDFRHQQDLTLKTRFVGQVQQWSDRDFLNDWFHDDFENQNGPRTFANLTHTRPGHIMTLTASPTTHSFLHYSEKLPEATYHLLDRQIAKNLYLSWDSFAGYYELEPAAITTERLINIARLSYDIQLGRVLNILPFVEGDYSIYEDRLIDEDSEERLGVTGGVTFQSRFQRTMRGIGPYGRLKHIVVPSVTYVYRPDPTGDADRIPQLDGLDFRPGRERVEGKIENVLLAKHAETGDVWQLAHLALYAGTDFESEIGTSDDIEMEFSFRPVPKWGLFASAEHHDAEAGGGVPGGEFNRALGYIFYDNAYQSNTFNARLGYSYSDLDDPLEQRELLYGAGIRLGKKWSFGFEHRLELENSEITRETYEIRRLLHEWEVAVRVRDREEGIDASVQITLIDFPTASLNF